MSQALFDALRVRTGCKTDKELAKVLHISGSHISSCRSGDESVGAEYILKIHDYTGMSIQEIRSLIRSDAPKKPSGRQVAAKVAAEKREAKAKKKGGIDLLAEITARPKRAQRKSTENSPRHTRLSVTKTPMWTSIIHRSL